MNTALSRKVNNMSTSSQMTTSRVFSVGRILLIATIFFYAPLTRSLAAGNPPPDPTCGDQPFDSAWGPMSSVSFDLPSSIVDGFNVVTSKIGVSVSQITVSANQKSKDCCKDAEVQDNGVTDTTGTVAATIYGNQVAVPGMGFSTHISQSLPIGTVSFDISAGATVSVNVPLTGSIGKETNNCDPNAGCVHGNLGSTGGPGASGAAVTLSYGVTINACYSSWWSGMQCGTVEATANAATSISGQISYNEPCSSGLGGGVTIGAVVAYIECKAGPYKFTVTYNVSDGFSYPSAA